VVAVNRNTNRAICWVPEVDGTVLRAVFDEIKALELARPIKVYGYRSLIAETRTFRFEQVSPAPGDALAESIRERIAALVDDPTELAEFLDDVTGTDRYEGDFMSHPQARALGWLEGAAEALDMTVLEFVYANT